MSREPRITACAILTSPVNATAINPLAPAPSSGAQLRHVPELDGIRGLAALAVFCHHLLFTSIDRPERWNRAVVLVAKFSAAGAYGVDIFFVLSGFLITTILLLDRPRPHYYWNFYWKRALRIFPLYIVALALVAALLPESRKYVVLSALFIANFTLLFHVSADGPFWTLAIEEQFYLVWPQFTKRLTRQRLATTAIGLAVGCLLLRLADAIAGHHYFRYTFFHCDGLALGALLACQQLCAVATPDSSSKPVSPHRCTWPLAMTALILSVLPSAFSPGSRPGMVAEALQITGVSLLGYCIVRAAVERTGTRLLAPLRSSSLVFFGLISYCLYVSHLYVLRIYDHYLGPPPPGAMLLYIVRFFAVLVITVAICLVSRSMIELPAMRLRRLVLRS